MWTILFMLAIGFGLAFITANMITAVRKITEKRKLFIASYEFPESLHTTLDNKYGIGNSNAILRHIRAYFLTIDGNRDVYISIPSEEHNFVIQNFILLTSEYRSFCSDGFGKLLYYDCGSGDRGPSVTFTSSDGGDGGGGGGDGGGGGGDGGG